MANFFDKLSDALTATGKDVAQKTKDVTETAKLTVEINSRKNLIENKYRELGKAYYEVHSDNPEFPQVEEIAEAFAQIRALEAQIADIKGETRCASCGAVIGKEAKFCASCGAPTGFTETVPPEPETME
ncbi:MAG: zinc ribbon domain-containing protein [Eubacteriales bacterium]|nr:zinc ribbon domain-containing protein [Eubacteriales bacterium]